MSREEYSNPDFEDYYKMQGIVPDEEWPTFMATLRTVLPSTFRINGSGKFANSLRDKLNADFFSKLVGNIVVGSSLRLGVLI
jgi:hypothetical protein